mgnify:CR=1 FL=1
MSSVIITMIATLVIVAPITWLVSSFVQKKIHNTTIGNANDKAREIIDEALKTAETKKKESLLEIKEESLKTRNELEKETKERRAEYSVMKDVSFLKKKLLIRRLKPLRSVT